MKIELNKEDIKELLSKDILSEYIADKIIQEKTNQGFNEFESELLRGIEKAVDRIANEWVDRYMGKNYIEKRIEKYFEKKTDEQIIKIILERLKT